MTDANYFPAVIANYILGGGAEARLFMNLREKMGLLTVHILT
jgi:predicted Zn-dependent peptidase